ncbi:hypothetical protein [Natroniella sp. ANB-PHB2]|uniref:hypothetical protein n=1 Tax=Natroniella sp. ANB-PHB2 TaxID=3384444 RepID=UPI0038D3A185
MTKRKFILLLVGSLSIVLLTGCMKLRSNVLLNKDGSGQIEYIFGMESSFYTIGGQEVSNFFIELEDVAIDKGYEVNTFDDGNYVGLIVSKEVADLTSYERKLGLFGEIEEKSEVGLAELDDILSLVGIEKENSFLATTYMYDKEIDLTELAWEDDNQINQFFSTALLKEMDLGLELDLPVEPTESNATLVKEGGNKLIWELVLGEKNQIYFELRILRLHRIMVLLLVAVGAGLVVTKFRKDILASI